MKHFDTHVRLAIGWKTFGINALTDFSCQSDKSVSKADKTSPRSPRSSAHHVSSYKIIHVISVSGDMQWHAEYDNIPPTPQILQHYCQIKTLTSALSPRSGGREVRSCQPRRHSHKSGAERERGREGDALNSIPTPASVRTRPHKIWHFQLFYPSQGQHSATIRARAVKSNELRLMRWSNFPKKQFSFKLLRCCDDVCTLNFFLHNFYLDKSCNNKFYQF